MLNKNETEKYVLGKQTMILSDYLLPTFSEQWELMKQIGVNHAVVRLPENNEFDITNPSHIRDVAERYKSFGLTPIVVEPMPNSVHEHIKRGDKFRDESIDKVLHMIPLLSQNGFSIICTNFMAEIGWYRTSTTHIERGGAQVTSFNFSDALIEESLSIQEDTLWENLSYFLNAIMPIAEENNIHIALHPDDPPIEKLGNVSRILTNKENIQKALDIYPSKYLGVTFCQGTFAAMGEDVYHCIDYFGNQGKICFVHFRDIVGTKANFHETFHDNGMTDMARAICCYRDIGFSGPVRIDHVPTMVGEFNEKPGYATIGRLYAIGYLRGLCEASKYNTI